MATMTVTERAEVLAPVGLTPLLTKSLLAARYGVSEWTVRQWVQQGCPTVPIRLGRGIRFDLSQVEAWMAAPVPEAA